MKYIIVTDSTIDLPNDYVVSNNLNVIPLQYTLNNKSYYNYLDNRDMSVKDFYDEMRKGNQPTTSQINSVEFMDFFTPFLEQGLNILYICFSSALSGTFNSARLAKEELLETYKDLKIEIMDSKQASASEGLLVHYALKNQEQGLSLEDNLKSLESIQKKIVAWFTVNDIETLRRGGRVSNVQAYMAKALNIQPVLHINEEGKLIPKKKKVGRKVAIKELLNQMENRFIPEENDMVIISHGDCIEDALYLQNLIKEKYNFDKFMISDIGPVIGSHTGPNVLALYYIGSHK